MGGSHLYDCSYCEENPYYLSVLGHDGPPAGMYRENLVTGIALARCPRRDLLLAKSSVTSGIESARLELYPLWLKGMLLLPGSVGEQPARDLAFMREFDSVRELTQAKADQIRTADGGADGEVEQ